MQKDRKKEHKKIVKNLRRHNKRLAADEYLGLNRFRLDLFSEDCYRYSDGSGVELKLVYKITDLWTGNTGYFVADNYDFYRKTWDYLNDFLIRCDTGHRGHWPPLNYMAYDVHEVLPYAGDKHKREIVPDVGVIDTYSWLNGISFGDKLE